MLKKKHSIISLPVFAFFSKQTYREIGRDWKGSNFAYLFLLLAICCIVPTISLHKQMLNTLGSNQRHIINQLPDIHIRNGRVLLNQMQPHVIRKEDGTPVAIIDTTGSMNFIYNEHVNVLLTETKLIVRRGKYTFNTLDLAQVEEFDLTKDVVYGWIQKTWGIVTPMTYAIFLLMSYIFTAMVMLLIATVGLFISSAMHTSLRFSALLRIGAAAATPSIILITVFSALEIPVPRLLYIACILVYLLMGIRACRPSNEKKDSSVNLLASLHDL